MVLLVRPLYAMVELCCDLKMEYINLFETKLPLVGLGTYSQHGEVLRKSITTSLEVGINYFDTAYKYQNEKEIGRILKYSNIDSIVLQSKVCARQLLGSKKWLWLDKESVEKSYKKTCKRLEKDSIDVFLLHSVIQGQEKYYEQLMRLRDHKAVKVIGVCNFGIDQLEQIKKRVGEYPMLLQAEIHPYHSQKELIRFCKQNNILLEARSTFAHGDMIREWNDNPTLKQIAEYHKKTIPQIILRWIVQQDIIAMTRSSNPIHIKENTEIFDFELLDNQMSAIDSLNQNRSFGYVSTLNI